MVASTTAVASSSASTASKVGKLGKGLALGSVLTAAFCIFDFLDVPKTLNSKYDSKGEKVEGKNWNGALKEIGKSTPKCLVTLSLPLILGGGIAGLVAPMVAYTVLDKLLPHESKLIAKACKEKGIDVTT